MCDKHKVKLLLEQMRLVIKLKGKDLKRDHILNYTSH